MVQKPFAVVQIITAMSMLRPAKGLSGAERAAACASLLGRGNMTL
jgi:hypothetical protein